jgi:hypothetical protein
MKTVVIKKTTSNVDSNDIEHKAILDDAEVDQIEFCEEETIDVQKMKEHITDLKRKIQDLKDIIRSYVIEEWSETQAKVCIKLLENY